MAKKGLIILIALTLLVLTSAAEEFRFKYNYGEKYKLVTRVNENVYINGSFSHQAEILNKIAVEVVETRDESGLLSCSFQTSERSYGIRGSFSLTEDYKSLFWRNAIGEYDIGEEYFMPVVRDVPIFPLEDVEPGDSWVAVGEEVHDLRASFGLKKPFRFPISVHYNYTGDETREGRTVALIKIEYNFFQAVGRQNMSEPGDNYDRVPAKIAGSSEQLYYWDKENGNPLFYEEEFDFIFYLTSGEYVEYAGSAYGDFIESPDLNRERVVEEIERAIEESNIKGASVKSEEEGVTITLENIQFLPDSPLLLESEKAKLLRIAEILKTYPERDILITGHTARVGTEESSQALSEERAKAVADFLLSLNVRDEMGIISRGFGSRKPIGDNSIEAGRLLNRRVEITILEN
ncbi:MAG: OmpA family protein [Spirochaeta sp.]|nr:OmpA family protein [Spirochaeta sp.]